MKLGECIPRASKLIKPEELNGRYDHSMGAKKYAKPLNECDWARQRLYNLL